MYMYMCVCVARSNSGEGGEGWDPRGVEEVASGWLGPCHQTKTGGMVSVLVMCVHVATCILCAQYMCMYILYMSLGDFYGLVWCMAVYIQGSCDSCGLHKKCRGTHVHVHVVYISMYLNKYSSMQGFLLGRGNGDIFLPLTAVFPFRLAIINTRVM